MVSVRLALTNSLNVATVKVAEMVGYGRVVQVSRQMGLGSNIRPTPAVALTALARSKDRVRALAAGFQTHMPKPVDPGELVLAVANLRAALR